MARQAKAKKSGTAVIPSLYIDGSRTSLHPQCLQSIRCTEVSFGFNSSAPDMAAALKIVSGTLLVQSLSNAGTPIWLSSGDADAKRFCWWVFFFLNQKDLQKLKYRKKLLFGLIDRILIFSLSVEPLKHLQLLRNKSNISFSRSREKYSTPREEVEKILRSSRDEIETVSREENTKKYRRRY